MKKTSADSNLLTNPVAWPHKPAQPKPCHCKCNCRTPPRPIPLILKDARAKYVAAHAQINKMTTLDPGQGTIIFNALNSLATLFKEISDNVLGTPEENNVGKTQETVKTAKTTTLAKIVATTPPYAKKKTWCCTLNNLVRLVPLDSCSPKRNLKKFSNRSLG